MYCFVDYKKHKDEHIYIFIYAKNKSSILSQEWKNITTFIFTLCLVLRHVCRKANQMEKTDFEILSEKLRPKLLSVARNFAYASGIEAEDVVQEALIALWDITLQGQEVRNIEAMATRITKNICVSHYRRIHLDTQSLLHDNYIGGAEATSLTDREDLRTIKKSIYASLTNTQREYLRMRNDEGMTLEEIAEVTGKPKTSIKSTISAARKQMLELIKKQL